MTMPHRASLASARELIGQLATGERGFMATNPYRLAHEHDMRGGRYIVRVHVTREVPGEIAQQAAGVVHALQRALDELSAALAGAPVKFPIFESLAVFAQRTRKAIAGMSDEAQATIEELQPYHAIGGYRNGPLWILQQLASAEAPRLAAGSVRSGTMGVNTQRKVNVVGEPRITTGPFTEGAIIASAATQIVGPDPKLDMYLRVEYALAFASIGPARGRDVVTLLGELCDHVEGVVFPALEPSLAS